MKAAAIALLCAAFLVSLQLPAIAADALSDEKVRQILIQDSRAAVVGGAQ